MVSELRLLALLCRAKGYSYTHRAKAASSACCCKTRQVMAPIRPELIWGDELHNAEGRVLLSTGRVSRATEAERCSQASVRTAPMILRSIIS